MHMLPCPVKPLHFFGAATLAGAVVLLSGVASHVAPRAGSVAGSPMPLGPGLESEWPEHVVDASRMFHCLDDESSGPAHGPLAVWADDGYRLVAFGAVREGATSPAYVAALAPGTRPTQEIASVSVRHVLRLEPPLVRLRWQMLTLSVRRRGTTELAEEPLAICDKTQVR